MSIEAMKQALEALNYLQGLVDTERGPKAAAALRQAIEQAENRRAEFSEQTKRNIAFAEASLKKSPIPSPKARKLKYAALAVGLTYQDGQVFKDGDLIAGDWDPLENWNDAMNLAVELKFKITINEGRCFVNSTAVFEGIGSSFPLKDDAASAIRSTIVMVAKSLGEHVEHMKEKNT